MMLDWINAYKVFLDSIYFFERNEGPSFGKGISPTLGFKVVRSLRLAVMNRPGQKSRL